MSGVLGCSFAFCPLMAAVGRVLVPSRARTKQMLQQHHSRSAWAESQPGLSRGVSTEGRVLSWCRTVLAFYRAAVMEVAKLCELVPLFVSPIPALPSAAAAECWLPSLAVVLGYRLSHCSSSPPPGKEMHPLTKQMNSYTFNYGAGWQPERSVLGQGRLVVIPSVWPVAISHLLHPRCILPGGQAHPGTQDAPGIPASWAQQTCTAGGKAGCFHVFSISPGLLELTLSWPQRFC